MIKAIELALRKNSLFIDFVLFILSSLSTMGCEGQAISDGYINNIVVNKSSLTLKVGDMERLKASTVPSPTKSLAFQWRSENDAIATVSNGLVVAVAVGETFVTVSYQDFSLDIPVKVNYADSANRAVVYDRVLNSSTSVPEILVNNVGQYTPEGLNITSKSNMAELDKFYALAERMIQYRVKFSNDAKTIFKSSEGDFITHIDVENKNISIATNPVTENHVDFLSGNREYLVEIYHIYQQAKVRIIDIQTGKSAEVSAIHDGQGGCGEGALQEGFNVGMQWDKYCFGLSFGSFMLIKQITVFALKDKVKLLIYGDSISQPEGYFPTKDFHKSWTQLIIKGLNRNAMSSGRGGGTIDMILDYIKNELPYIDAEYVMVTIGTNGGNTEKKLTELIHYIQSQGSIPILNNIPCNESGTQVKNNKLIDQVRKDFGINGCKFDLATSINGDGLKVDKSMMYWEDYTDSYGWLIYHHPNRKGSREMFKRSITDIPEIYE